MSQRLPLLITGITGVAGYNALHYFQKRYPGQVIGTRPVQSAGLRGPGIVALDADNLSGLRDLFEEHRFRSVLNCVGNCALKSCELDPKMAQVLNVVTAAAIVENARKYDARLVHLSSDLVFSGNRDGRYIETDPLDPVTVYGKTMAEAEGVIAGADPSAAILRISLPMGISFSDHAGAIDWIQWRFKHNMPATLYYDEIRSITYTDDMNPVFEAIIAGREHGIFHLGGPRALTLFQVGQIINRVGGFEPALLHGCPRKDAGPMPPRAGDCSMLSGKLIAALGYQPFSPWPAGEEFWPTGPNWHRERLPAGSLHLIRDVLYHYPDTTDSIGRAEYERRLV